MVDSKVNIPVNIKGSQPQIQRIKKQDEDEHWISEEELYTEGSSDEEKPSNLSRKHLKGRKSDIKDKSHATVSNLKLEASLRHDVLDKSKECDNSEINANTVDQRDISWRPKRGSIKLPGVDLSEIRMSLEEILKKESDLMEMKNSIRRLEDSLANGKVIDEIYDVGKIQGKFQDFDVEAEGEKIAARIAEIKDLDKTLKLKAEEIKTAKLERMREAEESTELLRELSKSETSEAVKSNSEQFLKLLQNEVNDHGGASKVKVARRDKAKLEEAPRKPGTFIERNIQLAKCGDGVLSLTDEEKLRLKIVLKDIDDSVTRSKDQTIPDCFPTENQYALSDETKKALEEIDQKLEEHEKTKFSLNSIRSVTTLREKAKNDGGKEKVEPKIQRTVDNELKRLKEVDKMLISLSSTTNEVINPLLDEDLQYLIEESRQVMFASNEKEQMDSVKTPSKEKIVELVSAAKSGMPNFRFRYE